MYGECRGGFVGVTLAVTRHKTMIRMGARKGRPYNNIPITLEDAKHRK